MADQESKTSSWLILFIVTGISCFGFSLVIKILDGQYSGLLIWAGAISSSLALFILLVSLLNKPGPKKRKPGLADKNES